MAQDRESCVSWYEIQNHVYLSVIFIWSAESDTNLLMSSGNTPAQQTHLIMLITPNHLMSSEHILSQQTSNIKITPNDKNIKACTREPGQESDMETAPLFYTNWNFVDHAKHKFCFQRGVLFGCIIPVVALWDLILQPEFAICLTSGRWVIRQSTQDMQSWTQWIGQASNSLRFL